MVQLFYDSVREEPIYQDLLPRQYWRAISSVTVGIVAVWLLTKFSKEPPRKSEYKMKNRVRMKCSNSRQIVCSLKSSILKKREDVRETNIITMLG
jgi:hypothetical protein